MLFGCPRQNINHSSENLKVIYIREEDFSRKVEGDSAGRV